MKKLILITFLMVIASCRREAPLLTCEATVINNSGRLIKFESYFSHRPNVDPVITKISDEEMIRWKDKSRGCGAIFWKLFGRGDQRDSLKVIFYGDTITKVQFYTSDYPRTEMNPLNTGIYGFEKYTYTFTEEHFETAEPCPDCK